MNEKQPNDSQQGTQHAFTVHNIYVKDVSYEAPNTPQIFALEWKPRLDFDLQMSSQALKNDVFEVILDVTVTVKLDAKAKAGEVEQDAAKNNSAEEAIDEKMAFLVEVKQVGIFSAHGFETEQVERLLATTAPGILFPYLRETVSSAVVKGGFPQLVLPPMNFDAMYLQHLANQKKEQEEAHTG